MMIKVKSLQGRQSQFGQETPLQNKQTLDINFTTDASANRTNS